MSEEKNIDDLKGVFIPKREEFTDREKWFLERIGKRIFRNDNGCSCRICQIVVEKGLIVSSELHADYLFDTESDYNAEGFPLKYFDTKEEATEFSVQKKD